MNDSPTPRPSTDAAFRRPRKPSRRTVDDERQRERKRALDRKAQKASREKTRSHITHLEKMVRILSDKNAGTATGELLKEMGHLHAEIDRLRKIIDGIKLILGNTTLESTTPRQNATSTIHDRQGGLEHGMHIGEPSSWYSYSPPQIVNDRGGRSTDDISHEPEACKTANMEVYEGSRETGIESKPDSVRDTLDWANSLSEASVTMTGRQNGMGSLNSIQQPVWSLPSPMNTGLLNIPEPEFAQCKYWTKANSIYARIFDYDREGIKVANTVDSGSLFKVVKNGWGSLSPQERANPVLQILEEVDQNLFWDLDPVTKIANLYKSHLILKYYFNAEERNLDLIPSWLRPVHSQKTRPHPLPIDFFPWPALRDRLVRHSRYYFATTEFSVNYRQHFKFNWPFSFEETYRYSPVTGSYQISPLFELYYANEKCWSMGRNFFQKFPECLGEIPIYDTDPRDASFPPSPALLSDPLDADISRSAACGASNINREDECMMALFDELPPT